MKTVERPTAMQILRQAFFCLLLTLAAGGHMVVNGLDEWIATSHSSSREVHQTVYWLHEYLFHRIFAAATSALWLHLALCSEDETPPPPGLVALGIVQGVAQGYFWIGTRAWVVAVPMQLLQVATRYLDLPPSLLRGYLQWVGMTSLLIEGAHFVQHNGMPTFDDLKAEAGTTSALSAGFYQREEPAMGAERIFAAVAVTGLAAIGGWAALKAAGEAGGAEDAGQNVRISFAARRKLAMAATPQVPLPPTPHPHRTVTRTVPALLPVQLSCLHLVWI